MIRVAVLDDYAGVALELADWSPLEGRADVVVFRENLSLPDEAAEALRDFDVLCCMRERMSVPAELLERLPRLKLIAITGPQLRTLDIDAATSRGIVVSTALLKGGGRNGAMEMAWALILASVRHVPDEHATMRAGGWQTRIGQALADRTLGLLGLGRLGKALVPVAKAFEMPVIAWSQNMTPEAAEAAGAEWVPKEDLFRRSDVLSIQVVLSARTRGLVGAAELALMKPTAHLVNTARGPIVDRNALVEALETRRIAGAAFDVFDIEPLPKDDPLRRVDNLILTPHLGYATEETLGVFYTGFVDNIVAYLDGKPAGVINPEVLRT